MLPVASRETDLKLFLVQSDGRHVGYFFTWLVTFKRRHKNLRSFTNYLLFLHYAKFWLYERKCMRKRKFWNDNIFSSGSLLLYGFSQKKRFVNWSISCTNIIACVYATARMGNYLCDKYNVSFLVAGCTHI